MQSNTISPIALVTDFEPTKYDEASFIFGTCIKTKFNIFSMDKR